MDNDQVHTESTCFTLSHQGEDIFTIEGENAPIDHLTKSQGCIRPESLCDGMDMYSIELNDELKNEYGFEVSTPQMNISFSTVGRSCINYNAGKACSGEIIHTPSTCTMSYLTEANGTWRPAADNCRLMTLNITPMAFQRLWEEFGTTLPKEMHPLAKGKAPLPFFLGLPISPAVQRIANSLENCPIDGPGRKLMLECKALELMIHLTTLLADKKHLCSNNIPLSSTDIERIHAAREHLESNFEHPPSLTELSRHTGLNEFKLKRGFRQVFGTTPFGHLRTVRLEMARSYLERGDMNVYEACVAVGYSSLSNFIALFKKQFGSTPGKILQCALRTEHQKIA